MAGAELAGGVVPEMPREPVAREPIVAFDGPPSTAAAGTAVAAVRQRQDGAGPVELLAIGERQSSSELAPCGLKARSAFSWSLAVAQRQGSGGKFATRRFSEWRAETRGAFHWVAAVGKLHPIGRTGERSGPGGWAGEEGRKGGDQGGRREVALKGAMSFVLGSARSGRTFFNAILHVLNTATKLVAAGCEERLAEVPQATVH